MAMATAATAMATSAKVVLSREHDSVTHTLSSQPTTASTASWPSTTYSLSLPAQTLPHPHSLPEQAPTESPHASQAFHSPPASHAFGVSHADPASSSCSFPRECYDTSTPRSDPPSSPDEDNDMLVDDSLPIVNARFLEEATEEDAGDARQDDGAELARLIKLHQRIREGDTPVAAVPQAQAVSVEETRETQETRDEPCRQSASRHDQAREFLESLVLGFLRDLHSSVKYFNDRDEAKDDKYRARVAKRRAKRKRSTNDDGDDESVEQESTSQESCDTQAVGIKIKVMSRKTGVESTVSWPDDPVGYKATSGGRTVEKMACILRVALSLYDAVLSGTSRTKRDIFYEDVKLYKDQRVVDKIIDDLVATAGMKRADFNVCASSKGLVASGSLSIFLKTGDRLSLSSTMASLIPTTEKIDRVEVSQPLGWILVVEKDAVFNTLCSAGLLDDPLFGPGVLITGKGYPDLATLQLLSRLHKAYPSTPIYALVDGDPHGIDILSTYTYGSASSKHSPDHQNLHLGSDIHWIGVKMGELQAMGLALDGLLPLSERDATKAMAMLRDRQMPQSWRRELVEMLHLNRKADIEVVLSATDSTTSKNRLVEYVVDRISSSISSSFSSLSPLHSPPPSSPVKF